jgi:hypothetical protein
MSVQTRADDSVEELRTVGAITLWSAVAVALILGVHPPGSTSVYGDGVEFVEHVSPLWIAIHLVGAFVTLAFPLGVTAWGESLTTARGRAWGRLAGMVALVGTGIGVVHLVATDTIAVAFFEDTVETAGADAVVSADLLLRLHAGTLTAWIIGFWLGVQVVTTVAAWLDERRGWELWLPCTGSLMLLVSLGITIAEGQVTTISDMVFLRVPLGLFLLWLGLVGHRLRRDGGGHRRDGSAPSAN